MALDTSIAFRTGIVTGDMHQMARDGANPLARDVVPNFSLIVATVGRVEELRKLLNSLTAQGDETFEVIVVDQNDDDRLAWLSTVNEYPFPVRWERLPIKHASIARNVGLQVAAGNIVTFPDDDCTYPANLLCKIRRAFRDAPELGVLTGPVVSPGGGWSSGRWQPHSGHIGIDNVWICVACANLFMRRKAALAVGGFDERLGPGSVFGSCEENDFVLRALGLGWHGWYDISQRVVHPDKRLTPVAVERAFSYGAGMGFALRRHAAPARVWLTFLVRPLGGCLLNAARLRPMQARYYWRTLCGRTWGFRAGGKRPSQAG